MFALRSDNLFNWASLFLRIDIELYVIQLSLLVDIIVKTDNVNEFLVIFNPLSFVTTSHKWGNGRQRGKEREVAKSQIFWKIFSKFG